MSALEKTTFLSLDYPPHDGGIARLSGEVARLLQENAPSVEVLAQSWDGNLGSDYPEAIRLTSKRPRRELAALAHLRKRKSAILAGVWYPDGLIALMAQARPIAILAHGLELMPTRQRWRRRPWKHLCRLVLERADLVVANSQYTENLVRKVAPSARAATIPLAVNHRRFSPGDRRAARLRYGVNGKTVISTVARIHAYKGHDTVLRALAELPGAIRQDLIYLVAGQGPAIPDLKNLAKELGVTEQVRWLGFVSEEGLPDLYRASNLFVLCTRESTFRQEVEGFGMVFLEAQACRTPVIGTCTGGIPDAVKNQCGGWLIDQDDVGTLSDYLEQLVKDPVRFQEAGAKARARVERHCTWRHYAERLIPLLKEVGFEF